MTVVRAIIISIFCFASVLFSQNVWSFKAGVAYSEMQEANIPHSIGLSLGVVRHFQIFGNLFSDIEFTVTNKKANYGKIRAIIVNGPIYGLVYSAQLNLNLFMVEIPVMLKYKINLTKIAQYLLTWG